MNVRIIIGITILCMASLAIAEDPYQVAWSAQIGTPDNDYITSVTGDSLGNSYICGRTSGDLYGSNAGRGDVFLAKYDPSGNEIWHQQFGTLTWDEGMSVATDAAGNSYVAGKTRGDLFQPNLGDYDAFLAKIDASGNEVWSRQIGTSAWDEASFTTIDSSGNIYIAGHTEGSLSGPTAGGEDILVTKFDPSGNELWSRQIGTAGDDRGRSVAVDASGNIYITGETSGSLAGEHLGEEDAFLIKLDASGDDLWSLQMGTPDTDSPRSVAVDASGNAYIGGWTRGDLGLGGPDADGRESDAFLAKFDPSGNELWARQFGTPDAAEGFGNVVLDAAGDVYVGGNTSGDLGGTNEGAADVFLTKFDASGNELWNQQFGSSGSDSAYAIAMDASGDIYFAGTTSGDLGGVNAGSYDAFLVKLTPVPEPATILVMTAGAMGLLRRRGK